MKLTKELLEKAKSAKSAEELLTLAKESGVELTADEAEKYFAAWNKAGEISDEELENVSGGSQCRNGSLYSSDPPYYLITTDANWCPACTVGHTAGNGGTCGICTHHVCDGIVMYCHARKYYDDPFNED